MVKDGDELTRLRDELVAKHTALDASRAQLDEVQSAVERLQKTIARGAARDASTEMVWDGIVAKRQFERLSAERKRLREYLDAEEKAMQPLVNRVAYLEEQLRVARQNQEVL